MENKMVLITGGSSDIAKPLIDKILNNTSCKMIITSYNNEKNYKEDRILEIKVDFSTQSGINQFLKQIESYNISHYIQLQGNAFTSDTLETQNYDELISTLNINTLSTSMILSQLLPKMKVSRFGRIVLTSTASAEFGGGKNSFAYGLSKYGIGYLVKHLAKYYSEFGIITNAVSPGFIKTKFHTDILKRDEAFLNDRGKTVKIGYCGLPKDVSNLIFNLTFENNFICGEIIKIDGADFI